MSAFDCEFVHPNPHEWYCYTHHRLLIAGTQEPNSCGATDKTSSGEEDIGADIVANAVRVARAQTRHVAADMTATLRRYCEMCDAWVSTRECSACGADTVRGKL